MGILFSIAIDDIFKHQAGYPSVYIFPILMMSKFLYKLVLFIALILLCAIGLDMFLSWRLRTNENRMFATWNYVYNDTTDYDLVINGNSRAWVQYDPMILDSILEVDAFNLGMDGSAINRQILKYQKYCELHGYPKYLIQNIDISTMAMTNGYEREQFFSYFFYDRDLMWDFDQYEHFSVAEKYIPAYRYIGYENVLLEAFFYDNKQHFLEFTTKGYLGKNSWWDGTALSKLDSITCSCDTGAINLFVDFLEKVTSDGTKVLFVYAPIYYQAREKMVNEREMFEMYDSIANRFNIPILDYNDIPMCYDTTYFYNATHLNKTGAELFTTRLAHDIDSIRWLK